MESNSEISELLAKCRSKIQNVVVIRNVVVVLGLIAKLSSEFELDKKFQSAASILQGDLTISWANLMDTKSNKLRRYGQVHPELGDALDPDIENLAEIAFNLSTILGQTKQEKP
jgi:hypothetical protein